MKLIIVLSAVLAIAVAAPAEKKSSEPPVEIVSSEFEVNPDGYSFSYESGDGSARQEKAIIINPGEENEKIAVKGSYRYTNEKSEVVEVSYTSDENGFVPVGTVIHPSITKNAEAAKNNVDENEGKQLKMKH